MEHPEQEKKPLRPTQIAVIVLTASMMVLTAVMFGYGLYCVLHPEVITEEGKEYGTLVGGILLGCALIPAGGVWGLWMLWNDLATRTPGSAKKFNDK